MSDKNCPFCGSPVEDDHDVCPNCRDSAEKRRSDFFSEQVSFSNDSEGDSIEDKPQPEEESIDIRTDQEPEKPKKKISKTMIFYFSLCAVVLVLGLGTTFWVRHYQETKKETEITFWNECVKINTPLEYSKYLVRFPTGLYVDEARKRITEFRENERNEWESLKKGKDLNKFYSFVSQYPESPYIQEARNIMDSLSWTDAQKVNTSEAYLAYIENSNLGNISGLYLSQAQNKYNYLSTLVTLQGEQLDSIKIIVTDFFKALTDEKIKDLTSLSANEIKPYFKQESASPQVIINQRQKEVKENKIKELEYVPNVDKIKVIQDSTKVYFGDLSLNINTKYNNKKLKDKTETIPLLIELNKEKKIQSISIKEKAK